MLRDLIYALNGYPGNIFKKYDGKVQIVSGLPNITSSEEAALNILLHLSTKFCFFLEFIQNHSNTIFIDKATRFEDGLRPGCYMKGFCNGLSNTLQPYKQTLISLEKEIIKFPHLSFFYIQQELNKFVSMFDAIYNIITLIKEKKCHGCQILNVLHKASHTGHEQTKKAIFLLIKHCHGVMYQQLSFWLLYGDLNDYHEEFFIRKTEEDKEKYNSTTKLTVSKQNEREFELFYDNLPSYITERYASIICFIGSSLNLFINHDCDVSKVFSLKLNMNTEKTNFDLEEWKLKGLLKEKEKYFLQSLKKLEEADKFVVADFEMLIDEIRMTVSRDLWTLCVKHAELVSTLHMLKDFYLLGRGELFLSFIDEADSLLQCPVTTMTEHDVRQALLRSASKVLMKSDSLPFQLFSLTIDMTKTEPDTILPYPKYENIDNGWSRLGLSLNVQWPLHTVLKTADLDKYQQLFKFLLRVRRTQSALHQMWLLQMKEANRNNKKEFKNLKKLQWTCRFQMQHFVDNLQYYLQADVLESSFTNLLNKVKTTNENEHDFELICIAHEKFLPSLLAQCFILSTTVCNSLVDILDLCKHFCEVMKTPSIYISQENAMNQFAKIWKQYSEKVGLFFQVLNSVCTNQCNPYIAQLTLRLDYNKFFSREKYDF